MNLFKKKIPLVSSLILSLGLVACSDVDTLLNTIVLPTTIEVSPSGIEVTNQRALSENSLSQAAGPAISGGSPGLPVELNLSKRHAISSNLSTNYFKYTVVAKDKWIIRAALNKPLDLAKTSYCRGKSNSFISIYTENFVLLNTVSCAVNLTHEFAESGTYILHMSYPVDYNGSFSLASMRR